MNRIGEALRTGKPLIATAEDCSARWSGRPNGERFRCYFCGHRFVPGDEVYLVYTNGTPGASGNPLVCTGCYGPDVIERWRLHLKEARRRFWWLTE